MQFAGCCASWPRSLSLKYQVKRWSVAIAFVAFAINAASIQGQTPKTPTETQEAPEKPEEPEEYYYAGGKRLPVTILKDRVGVIPREGEDSRSIEDAIEATGLTVVSQEKAHGIIIVIVVEEPLPKLESSVRQLGSDGKGGKHPVIKRAGLSMTVEDAELPVLLTDEFIVDFHDNVAEKVMQQNIQKPGIELVHRQRFQTDQFVLRSTDALGLGFLEVANQFYELPVVEFSHPNLIVPVVIDEQQEDKEDVAFHPQWHHHNEGQNGGTVDADIDTPAAWAITEGSRDVIIAVTDNEFERTHPDLAPNVWVNVDEEPGDGEDDDGNLFTDDVYGWDFNSDDNVITGSDIEEVHGTQSAGCVGARLNSEGMSGTCRECKLMLLRKASIDNRYIEMFDYARVMGADVITNSWTFGSGPVNDGIVEAIDRAATLGRNGRGAIVFFAMGNGTDNDCAGKKPIVAAMENVITVGRSTNHDENDGGGYGDCIDLLGPTRYRAGYGSLGITTTTSGFDHTHDFRGTSAATAIVAGIAGLMLDVQPHLGRLQVQRVLQDTADRIDDDAGEYDLATGFSNPAATGVATHGYGRANAFEAVRLVAPTDKDGCGGIDVLVRDNRLDWGNTEQPSHHKFQRVPGFIPHWQSADIKVDAPPYATPTPVTSVQFELFDHENPTAGAYNRVYVRVRNRGPNAAEEVTVKLHWALAGTALPALPTDFWSTFPSDSMDTSQWHPLLKQEITNLEYSGSSVANSIIDDAQVLQFDWLAPSIGSEEESTAHCCLFLVTDSLDDPLSPDSKSTFVVDDITPHDNNITQLNVVLQNEEAEPTSGSVTFFVRNPTLDVTLSQLKIDGPDGWEYAIDEFQLDAPFELAAGEERLVTLEWHAPKPVQYEELDVIQYTVKKDALYVAGGLTLRIGDKENEQQEDEQQEDEQAQPAKDDPAVDDPNLPCCN